MKLLKKESFIGKIFIFLGIILIAIGITAIAFYAFPILIKHRLGESNNMANAFKDLALFNIGTSNLVFALAGGFTSIFVGILSIVWGSFVMASWKITFKSKKVLVFTGIISVMSLGVLAPAAISIKKGTSDEIKIISDFNEVDKYFIDVYKDISGSMGGMIYTAAISGANKTLAEIQENKWKNASAEERRNIFELQVDFDPAAALKTGNIRDGLIYVHNIWSGNKIGTVFKGVSQIYKNPFSKILTPRPEVALIDRIFMGYVDAAWTGLSILSKQSVIPKNIVDNKPGTLDGDEGIPGLGNTKNDINEAVDSATIKLKIIIPEIVIGKEKTEEWKEHLELLKVMNDLMFRALMGQENKKHVSMSEYDNKNAFATIEYQLAHVNIKLKILEYLTKQNLSLGTNYSFKELDQKSGEKATETTNALFKIISKSNTISSIDKRNQARKIVADALGIKEITNDIVGNKPKNKRINDVIEQLLIYHGIFHKKHNSLMYKLNQFRIENGKEAAAENLYIYLARIGELSSDHYYLSQDKGESGSGRLTSANKKQYMFDFAHNTSGRINARALLAASIGVSSSDFIMRIVKGSRMEQKFKDHIFGDNLNTMPKINYDKATNTLDYESLYNEFLNR